MFNFLYYTLNKFHFNFSIFILLIYLLGIANPLKSSYLNFNNSYYLLTSLNDNPSNNNTLDFVKNLPILKNYGPLMLDINNINLNSNILFIPILNLEYKPLILAISCKDSMFNIKNNHLWRDWFIPFFTYELDILSDFCNK